VIAVGSTAPDFTLKDQNNQVVRLAELLEQQAVLLVFYPLAFTGLCSGELQQLEQTKQRYADAGVTVLTVSVDSVYSHKVFSEREGYTARMLADFWPHGQVAQAYGVFNDTAGFADRGTFLIGRDGVVRFAEHCEPGKSRNQDDWLAAVAALAAESASAGA